MLDRTEQPIFHTWEPDDPQSWRPSMKVWANGPGHDRHLAILPEKEIRIVKVKKYDLPDLKIRIDPCQDHHLLATLLGRQIRNHTYHLFVKLINELFICLFVRFSKLRRRPLLSAIVRPPTNIECMQQPGRGKVQCFKFSWSLRGEDHDEVDGDGGNANDQPIPGVHSMTCFKSSWSSFFLHSATHLVHLLHHQDHGLVSRKW